VELDSDQTVPAGKEPEELNDLRKMAERVTKVFVIPPDRDFLLSPMDKMLGTIREPYCAIGKAFCSNIEGLLSTITIPYQFAAASTQDQHWQRIFATARIRSLMLEAAASETTEQLTSRREEQAWITANSQMEDFVNSSNGKDHLTRDTLAFLSRSIRVDSFIEAALDLTFQGLVLTWSTLEVLARDCFTAHLNDNPHRFKDLLTDPTAKRRFDVSKVSLEVLSTYNFDLSENLGTFLAQQQDLSDLLSIKAVYGALFPASEDLRLALDDDKLRLLSLRRNLTVHQRGMIDRAYVAAASCSQTVGERLHVSPSMLEGHLVAVIAAASAMIVASAS